MNTLNSSNNAIVFVDANVADYQTLIADLPSDTQVVILDKNTDGIQQIANVLAHQHNLDAIHLISHGSAGSLLLGSTQLNVNNLSDYQTQLAIIGKALNKNGDILLYGCDVAQGEIGQQFLGQLSLLTGADIAASDDLTGAANQGGDWNLEVKTGAIETTAIQSPDYQYNLTSTVDIDTTTNGNTSFFSSIGENPPSNGDFVRLGQTFNTGGQNVSLTSMTVWMYAIPDYVSNTPLYATVIEWNSNSSVAIPNTAVNSTAGLIHITDTNINSYTFNFSALNLSASKQYAFILVDVFDGIMDRAFINGTLSNDYAGGDYIDSANGSADVYSTYRTTTYDLEFKAVFSATVPVANPDANSVTENGAVTGNVLSNDTGTGLSVGYINAWGSSSYGIFTIQTNGSYSYTEYADYLSQGQSVSEYIYYTLYDSNGVSTTSYLQISITGVNDAPTATNLSAAENYTEDTALNLTDIVISDVDSANVTATLTLSNTTAGSLTTATSGAVTSTFSAGVWTASGALANVNALLAGVTFTPASNYNSNFSIATSVSDGVSPAITGTKNFTGTAVNDAPTATNLSTAESYTEDTALNLTDIVISDVDSANVTATLTLSNINAGSLSTATSNAVTSTYNNSTGVWTASGALADVNTLLAGVTFKPAVNFNSPFSIATSVSDGVAAAITGTKSFTGVAIPDVAINAGITPVEGAAMGTFIVTLDSAPASNLTINYNLTDSTATATTDYSLIAGTNVTAVTGTTFTIAAGQTSATLNLNAVADGITDANEKVFINLTAGTGYSAKAFVTSDTLAVGMKPSRLSAADLNGDNQPDLIVANQNSGFISVFLRNATNTGFDSRIDYAGTTGGTGAADTTIVDINGDGKLDIVAANDSTSNSLSVFLRNADPIGVVSSVSQGFDTPINIAVGGYARTIKAADFNGDGKMDLVVTRDAGVSVFLRDTNGISTSTGFVKTNYVVNGINAVGTTVGDFNGDSQLDFAIAETDMNTVGVFLNNGTGNFTRTDYTVSAGASDISSGDFDSDGHLDLVVTHAGSVSVLLFDAINGGFKPDVNYYYSTYSTSHRVQVSDVNSDGKLDLIVSNYTTNSASVLLGKGDGTFATNVTYSAGFGTTGIAVADFNGDGKPDIAASNYVALPPTVPGTVSILQNNVKSSANLTITDVLYPPTAINLSTAETYTQDTARNLTDIVISDFDSATVTATLTLSSALAGSLNTATSNAVTSTYNSGTGVWTASGALTDVNILLAGVTFNPALNFNSNFTIATSVSDANSTVTGTKNFTVAVNNAPTFSLSDSIVTTPIGAGNDVANSAVIQSDGKILVAGYTVNGATNNFAITRYNVDGSLDINFGTGGKVTNSIQAGTAYDIALQTDGKILVTGANATNTAFVTMRYNSDGNLDTTFGTAGVVVDTLGSAYLSYAVAIQSNGDIVVGGSAANGDFQLADYLSNGTLNNSVGANGNGIFTVNMSGGDFVEDIAIQTDGKIVAVGRAYDTNTFGVARFNTNGSLDTTFHGNGKYLIDVVGGAAENPNAVALQTDGKILVAGNIYRAASNNNDVALIRLNIDGSLDTSFGTSNDGKVIESTATGDIANSVAIQADGKILVAGAVVNTDSDFLLIRYNTNGTLDTTFGNGGKVSTNISGSDSANKVSVQADGKIVLTGYSGTNQDFTVVRYNADGSLDLSFDAPNAANTLSSAISYTENAAAIALDSSVKIFDYESSVNGNYNGTTLTLARNSGANAEDVFGASGNLSLSAGNPVLSGVTIGTFTNSNGTLAINFNTNATQARVNETLSSLTYSNSSNNPATSAAINWTFNDGNTGSQGTGGALNTVGSTTVNITAVPDVNISAGTTPVEGGTVGTFTVTLDSPAPAGGLVVNYDLIGSNATLNTDYTLTAGNNASNLTANTFTINQGATSATLNIAAIADGITDANETVRLNLKAGAGYNTTYPATTSFANPASYATGSMPRGMTTFDYSGDGKLDLLVTNYNNHTISVFLGDGAGNFASNGTFNAGTTNPVSLAVGDFNNDGKNDFAISGYSGNSLSVFINNGIGTYSNSTLATGTSPHAVTTADLNNDGQLDIVSSNATGSVSIFRNNGNGTFTTSSIATPSAYGISINDFNSDGKQDLAITNTNSGYIRIYTGNGVGDAGSFTFANQYAVGTYPNFISGGDINQDGKIDLVTANNDGSGTVSVLLNTSSGATMSYATANTITAAGAYSVELADMNQDGKLDIVTNASLLLGDGTGQFVENNQFVSGAGSSETAVGDFNSDGKLDYAASYSSSNTVAVFLNSSNPTSSLTITDAIYPPTATNLTTAESYTEDTLLNLTDMVITDIDGSSLKNALNFDGIDDYVATTNDSELQLTTGTIEAWIKTPNAGSGHRGIVVKQSAYSLFLTDNVLTAYDWGSGVDRTTGINLADNQWHHVAMSFANGVTNGTNIYIDGVLKLTTTYNVAGQPEALAIGGGYASYVSQVFAGNIDEVRVWNTVRTQAQIQAAMNTQLTGSEAGLVSDYDFNQGTADGTNAGLTVLPDKTSNTNTGTLQNFALSGTTSNWTGSTHADYVSATLTLSNSAAGILSTATSNAVTSTFNAGVWTASGKLADVNALLAGVTFTPTANFNGNFTLTSSISDGVNAPITGTKNFTGTAVNDAPVFFNDTVTSISNGVLTSNGDLTTTRPTLELDVNWDGTGAVGSGSVLIYNGNTTNSGYGLMGVILANGTMDVKLLVGGATVSGTLGNFAANTWTHLGISLDNSNFYQYAIGATTGTLATSLPGVQNSTFYVANSQANNGPFSGQVDNIAVWNTALTSTQIASHGSLIGNEANLAGLWKLENNLNNSKSGGQVLTASGTTSFVSQPVPQFSAIQEDIPSTTGTTIANLIPAISVSDGDGDKLGGIAITGNAANVTTQGSWQYYNGSAWVNISTAVSLTSAFQLNTSTALRFLPVANFNGTPGSLSAYLIDNSSTFTNASSANLTGLTGGSGHYSASPLSLGISVSAVNDAPVLTTPSVINYVDTAFDDTFATVNANVAATDVDTGTTLTYGLVGGTVSGGTVSIVDTYGTLTLTTATGAYSFVPNDAAIEPLTSNVTRNFTVTVSDGLLSDSKTLVVNITQNGITESAIGDVLPGTSANDTINGGAGADTMTGGLGNDTYYVDNVGDSVVETSTFTSEIDTVISAIDYTLGANVENLTLAGTATIGNGNTLNNFLTGNNLNNLLTSFDGNDTINGGVGLDTMIGGAGNDYYYIDNVGDVVSETGGGGIDSINSTVDYTLTDINIENLFLSSTAINGTGNSVNNSISGNALNNVLSSLAGDDYLNGGLGADTMLGGIGNDYYFVDNIGDRVTELGGEGTDTINSSIDYTLPTNTENLTLSGTAISGTGNTVANSLVGNANANILSGLDGNDTLNGGGGNDTLSGGLGNDSIDGGLGADSMDGGTGNDYYVIDNLGDAVVETSTLVSEIDSVNSSLSYSLPANVENLTLTGTSAINATGNNLDNILTGNAANNILTGGLGNDTYVITTGDTVLDSGGTDTISTSFTYTLPTDIENLTLLGSTAINATGNTLANVLIGNAGNNIVDGGLGGDTMNGGAGNDSYIVDNPSDSVIEAIGAGTDNVSSSVNYTLTANVENLTLTGTATNATGNALTNVLIGNAANNVLNGDVGADKMTGGLGNDSYVVDNTGDIVTETSTLTTEIDSISSSVTYTLPVNVENLTLTGTNAINATGNVLNNTLVGNAANNILNGGLGTDVMSGGLGNDTYVIDNLADSVSETSTLATEIDTVNSSVTYVLGVNFENLTLTGVAVINATGNTLNNLLTGNAASNLLDGSTGVDTMSGGLGNDSYVVDNTSDIVTETSTLSGEIDTINSSVTYTLSANVENLTLTGAAAINATGNALNNSLIGNAANNILNGGVGADVMSGGLGSDTYIVDNVADSVSETSTLSTEIDSVTSSVNYLLGANVENLTLTGSAISGTGNALNNNLVGNAANNLLDGGAGDDILDGGLGKDTLTGGLGADIFKFLNPNTIDTLTDFSPVDDTMQLKSTVFTSLATPGIVAAASFISGATAVKAVDANDYLIYNTSTGVLYYDAGGNTVGSAAAVQIATLGLNLPLTNADFFVI